MRCPALLLSYCLICLYSASAAESSYQEAIQEVRDVRAKLEPGNENNFDAYEAFALRMMKD
jgi:hypothetical protein